MTTLERPRLLQQLHATLETGHVQIQAPAGYGKTTLLQHLVRQRPHTVYVACTPADIDLAHLRPRLLPHLQTGTTLIVDDVHLLGDGGESYVWLREQLDRTDLRFVLSGRRRMEWDMVCLEESDLRFTQAEGRALLARQYPTQTPATLEEWRRRLHGWAMGLQLLTQLTDSADPLPSAETHLFDYLVGALLANLPANLQHFLQLSAVPLQFSDALVTHLLGAPAADLRQEAERRNLFLEPAEQPGWFRYHDLVRDFLLHHRNGDPQPIFRRTMYWFEEQGDLEMAVEHALAGELEEEAVRLIQAVPPDFVLDESRYSTFRRWVLALSEEAHAARPKLLIRLGTDLHYTDEWRDEAWPFLVQGYEYAQELGDSALVQNALVRMASLHFRDGDYEACLARSHEVLAAADVSVNNRLYGLRMAGLSLARLGRHREAGRLARAGIDLALSADKLQQAAFNRINLAADILSSLGRFGQAHAQMKAAEPHVGGPAFQISCWLDWCKLYWDQGDWDGLLARFEAVEESMARLEVQDRTLQLELAIYRAAWAIGTGRFEQAADALDQVAEKSADDPLHEQIGAVLHAWFLRRQAHLDDAQEWIDARLEKPFTDSLNRARLLLERALCHTLQQGLEQSSGAETAFVLPPGCRDLVAWRCRADLVRLRALLAIACWQRNDRRWRRHIRAALYALKTYWGYEHLLTRRDPDLGAHFWPLVLVSGFADEKAQTALRMIGQPQPLYSLLWHPNATVRMQAAEGLAAVAREEALPTLGNARRREENRAVKTALDAAVTSLEQQPPPPLRVQMLGGFRLWRGDDEIPSDAWSRPIVQRLFQYLVLHRGKILSRDRILDDLWPNSDPRKAWTTLRNVYSRLRSVLEPHVQSKGLNRYVVLDGGSYAVDPPNVMEIDVEQFEQTVRQTLHSAHSADVPPLPPSFLDALDGYRPLLPELPFEDWLLETRQRLADLYIDGALYTAQTLLVRGDPARAEQWARRAVDNAPWLEEAYAVLVRALARQGQRSAALRVYETAITNLRQELDALPSPQTQWIAERLRQGKEV